MLNRLTAKKGDAERFWRHRRYNPDQHRPPACTFVERRPQATKRTDGRMPKYRHDTSSRTSHTAHVGRSYPSPVFDQTSHRRVILVVTGSRDGRRWSAVVLDRIEGDPVKGWIIHLCCTDPATLDLIRDVAERRCHPDDPLSLL